MHRNVSWTLFNYFYTTKKQKQKSVYTRSVAQLWEMNDIFVHAVQLRQSSATFFFSFQAGEFQLRGVLNISILIIKRGGGVWQWRYWLTVSHLALRPHPLFCLSCITWSSLKTDSHAKLRGRQCRLALFCFEIGLFSWGADRFTHCHHCKIEPDFSWCSELRPVKAMVKIMEPSFGIKPP